MALNSRSSNSERTRPTYLSTQNSTCIAATAQTTTNQMCVLSQEAVQMQKAIRPYQLPRLRWAVTALAVMLALAISSVAALAQSTQGSVIGTVKDS